MIFRSLPVADNWMNEDGSARDREFPLVKRERFIVFVMPISRLHKLNITLRPHTLNCDGEINRDTPDKIVLHS